MNLDRKLQQESGDFFTGNSLRLAVDVWSSYHLYLTLSNVLGITTLEPILFEVMVFGKLTIQGKHKLWKMANARG
jgi:hypothetical protein